MFIYIAILTRSLCLFFVANELKTLLNKINSDLNKRKDTHVHGLLKFSIIQIDLHIQHNFYQNTSWLFCGNRQTDPKIDTRTQATQNKKKKKKQSSERLNEVVGLGLPDFKPYHAIAAFRIMWYQHKDRHLNQGNVIGNSKINP